VETPSPPLLPYADALTRFGVVVDRTKPQETRIFVPGARWRDQPWLFVVLVSAVAVAIGLVMAISSGLRGMTPLVVIISSLPVLGVAIGGVTNTALPSVQRTLEFRISPAEFTVVIIGPRTNDFPGTLVYTWPLEQVGRIKGDLYGMGLTIQIVGTELLELMHGHSPALRVALASLLNETVEAYRVHPA
jgi:hypothetical protein